MNGEGVRIADSDDWENISKLYNEIIKVEESSYLKSKKFKEKIIPPSWTYLYKKITKQDDFLVVSFKTKELKENSSP